MDFLKGWLWMRSICIKTCVQKSDDNKFLEIKQIKLLTKFNMIKANWSSVMNIIDTSIFNIKLTGYIQALGS